MNRQRLFPNIDIPAPSVDTPASIEAAEKIGPRRETQRRVILLALSVRPFGLTRTEMYDVLRPDPTRDGGMTESSVRPRVVELRDLGHVVEAGYRPSGSGRNRAAVVKITAAGRRWLRETS